MCLLTEMVFAVYPLFGYTAVEDGGLGLSEAEIGIQLGMRAFFHIGLLVFYPALHRLMGNLRLYQAGMLAFPIVMFMFPTLNWMVRNGMSTRGWLFWTVLVIYFAIWSFCGFTWSACLSKLAAESPCTQSLL
jgi:hypothetical protein